VAAPHRPTATGGRILITVAAILWSLNGGFAKVLTQPTAFGLDQPPLPPMTMAFYRVLFAGLFLVPTLRRRDITFRPAMIGMTLAFVILNILFVWALTNSTAANALFLQYTAPMWMYLASIWWLGEPPDRRSSIALVFGLAGIGIIVASSWRKAELGIVVVALGSGVAYALVMLWLRILRDCSSRWLTVVNHLGSAVCLLPLALLNPQPSVAQLVVLFLFGTIQLGLPYWLVARGLSSVSPQEAGTITLLEPILSPVWAYLVAGERPENATMIGGAFILGALAWRYWPLRKRAKSAPLPVSVSP
jgi:drug/metabolite transporter (DMT)-like permease